MSEYITNDEDNRMLEEADPYGELVSDSRVETVMDDDLKGYDVVVEKQLDKPSTIPEERLPLNMRGRDMSKPIKHTTVKEKR